MKKPSAAEKLLKPRACLMARSLASDVVEVRQPLQVGAQPVGREPLLERRPPQTLGLVLPARRLERLDVGRFPLVVGGKSEEMQAVVMRGLGGAPLRPC